MTSTELKELTKLFRKRLSDQKDEWWGTDQEIWNDFAKDFVQWYNNYGRKELEKMRQKKLAKTNK